MNEELIEKLLITAEEHSGAEHSSVENCLAELIRLAVAEIYRLDIDLHEVQSGKSWNA